jgi:DsbC/DsbD-like thiol-disulfide interchange protein
VVTVTLHIDDGWYTYGNPVGNSDLAGSETTIVVAGKGKPKVVGIEYPKGTLRKDKVLDQEIEYLIYEGKVTIKATVQRAAGDTEPIEITAKFGACNKKGVCLLPAAVKASVP